MTTLDGGGLFAEEAGMLAESTADARHKAEHDGGDVFSFRPPLRTDTKGKQFRQVQETFT
ncbi:hypothetical protein CO655_19680 [Rhizobium sp. M1]|nr:hypothetical protein CO655_19680 [Rhizobium sp. M1]PDT37804.1 hypothetical protein CO671_06600 [Rhizobium sp. M10]